MTRQTTWTVGVNLSILPRPKKKSFAVVESSPSVIPFAELLSMLSELEFLQMLYCLRRFFTRVGISFSAMIPNLSCQRYIIPEFLQTLPIPFYASAQVNAKCLFYMMKLSFLFVHSCTRYRHDEFLYLRLQSDGRNRGSKQSWTTPTATYVEREMVDGYQCRIAV